MAILTTTFFAQLERLGDEEIKGEELQQEINRAKAISDIATQVISNGALALKAKTFAYEYLPRDKNASDKKFPPMLRASFLEE